ncbi:MAG: hypothetical protein J0H82_15330 [Alphaproteobacteria bacterium]|jgi:hypothetical protein|nr:hypothetical protein [Alphaproteobacteria bacterium]
MTDIGAAGRPSPTPAASAPAATSTAPPASAPASPPSTGADSGADNAVTLAASLARLAAGGPLEGLVTGRAGDGRALLRLAGQAFLFDDGQRLTPQARVTAELSQDGGQLSARLTQVDGHQPDPPLAGRLAPPALPAGTAARALAALADQLAQGSVRNATVLGAGQGGSIVLIDGAPYRLAGADGLKPGMTLTLRLSDGGQAQIVARDGTAIYPPLRAGLETVGSEALVRLAGKEVAGRVVPGNGQAVGLPPGSTLALRLLAPGSTAQGPSILSGYVAGTDPQGRALVQTAAGTLALALGEPLPLGARLSLDLLRMTPPGAAPQALLGRGDPAARAAEGWNAQVAGLTALRESTPELAAQITARLPQPGSGLAAALLGAAAALTSGEARGLLGRDGIAALDRSGRKEAARRALSGSRDLSDLAEAPAGPDGWQTLLLPLLDGPNLRQIALYVRGRKPGAEDSEGMPPGTRFVVDAPLEKTGLLQFDGYIRGNSIDLILRSGQALPADWRRDIQAIFAEALGATGYQGSLLFQAGVKFASPLDDMRRTAHDDGQVVI